MEANFGPMFKFTEPGTQLFVTGAPLSGKSTISPTLAASIEGCSMQNMDIFRLLAQTFDSIKPEQEREPTLNYGSCDGYLAIGNGQYTADNLRVGFRRYSKAVFGLAEIVIPSLEAQGAQSVLFEGVQAAPSLVKPYLANKSKLIIVTADEDQFAQNRLQMFGRDPVMEDRYSTEKLSTIQDEIVEQSYELAEDSVLRVDNTKNWKEDTLPAVVSFLQQTGVIKSSVS